MTLLLCRPSPHRATLIQSWKILLPFALPLLTPSKRWWSLPWENSSSGLNTLLEKLLSSVTWSGGGKEVNADWLRYVSVFWHTDITQLTCSSLPCTVLHPTWTVITRNMSELSLAGHMKRWCKKMSPCAIDLSYNVLPLHNILTPHCKSLLSDTHPLLTLHALPILPCSVLHPTTIVITGHVSAQCLTEHMKHWCL